MIFASLLMIDYDESNSYDVCIDSNDAICQTLFVNCTATAAEAFVNGEYTHGQYMEFTYNLCPNAYNECMTDVGVSP